MIANYIIDLYNLPVNERVEQILIFLLFLQGLTLGIFIINFFINKLKPIKK